MKDYLHRQKIGEGKGILESVLSLKNIVFYCCHKTATFHEQYCLLFEILIYSINIMIKI